MVFKKFASYLEQIEKTASRNDMTQILAKVFEEIDCESTAEMLYLLQGRVAPLYENIEFGIAEKMMIEAVSNAFRLDSKIIRQKNSDLGDIGNTVEFFRQKEPDPTKNLSLKAVFSHLKEIALYSGMGSQERKITVMAKLINNLDSLSCRYVVRIPLGKLRLGFSDMTILDSYSWMLAGDKSLRPSIEKAYHVNPDIGQIGEIIKSKGIRGLKNVKPQVFRPIIMMRAERLSSAEEILNKVDVGLIEPKYDGFRLQVHFKKNAGAVKLFSRSLEDVTYMYPDIVAGVLKEVGGHEVILEGEAIGFDVNTESFMPFQETVQRKRKYGIEDKVKEIPLKFFVFDILYIDGKSLLNTPFKMRRSYLEKAVKITNKVSEDTLMITAEKNIKDEHSIELAFDEAISRGLEGIMIKKNDGIYQPGARGWNWIKFKRSYSAKIEDTIDCLVMGYDFGRGKRTGFGIGAFLAGVYDEKKDLFMSIAKIGTGLTDDEWREIKKRADKIRSLQKPALYEVDKQMAVDVWIKPNIVVEIRADELTRSPIHTAGRTLKATKTGKAQEVDVSGFALRFPRLERFRDDKRAEETTTLQEIKKMYKQQKH